MKNFLIVVGVLFGCFLIAAFLVLGMGHGGPGGIALAVAEWRDYDDPDLRGLEVAVMPDRIVVDIPATPVFKQVMEKGRWSSHNFYCDSHLDAPAEVIVARELKNEDLEFDVGRYVPGHPGKIVCVMAMRGGKDYRPHYPVREPGQTVSYPPPKGLITPGMLECDLKSLPWHADEIDIDPSAAVVVHTTTLSDGMINQGYVAATGNDNNNDESPEVYNYHSDRSDAPKLLVTVYHGRVVEVNGGAEDTADIPYTLPPPEPAPDEQPPNESKSWSIRLFQMLFDK